MLRWIETSVYLPLMRVHGYMSNTEPWNYGPEAQRIIARCGDNDATPLLHDLNDRIMARTAAGPIALSVGRWIEHILANN